MAVIRFCFLDCIGSYISDHTFSHPLVQGWLDTTNFSVFDVQLFFVSTLRMENRLNEQNYRFFKKEGYSNISLDINVTKKSLAEQFKIHIATLKGILRIKDSIKATYKKGGIHSKKMSRMQSEKFDQLEKALEQPVNCLLVNENGRKEIALAQTFGIENFCVFLRWVEKLNNRHGKRILSGERAIVEEDNGMLANLPLFLIQQSILQTRNFI